MKEQEGKESPEGQENTQQISVEIPRSENDLDSITVGSSSKKQVKLYYNSRKDSKEELEVRCELAANTARYLEQVMKEENGIKE
jgi:hypothetical protein